MVTIEVSEAEKSGGSLSAAHLAAAVCAIESDGFVVLGNAANLSHLDVLHERLLDDLSRLQARPDAPYNWNPGNIQQDPPPFHPYLFADILLNELVIDVTAALLGSGVKNTFYSGNTALPGEHRQPVHADRGHLWPRLAVAHPPTNLVVNIPTVDVSPENGSTEIWPGTHLDITVTSGRDIKIAAGVLDRRRSECPPIQPHIRRGSVLIRDIRLWHAGMPNRTANPRPMIAMIHNVPWLETGSPLRFPAGTEAFFEHPRLRTCARFVEGEIDYIRAPHAYEFEPAR